MARATQIYTILNDLAQQMFGKKAVSVINTASMISLGADVLSTTENTDAFMGVLADRIGRTIFSIRRYEDADDNVVKHAFDFGIALQKIYVALPSLTENPAWEIGDSSFEPEFAPVFKPDVRQKLFSTLNTFEIAITVPDAILKTAFLSEIQMAVFIDALFMAVENRLRVAMESMVNITRAAFIARKMQSANPCTSINLLAEYNKAFGLTITAANALRNADFLKFCSSEIRLWTKRMRKMTTIFNEEGYERHTPYEDLVLTVLDNFESGVSAYLQADTFHDELVALPRFNSVPYWQGSGTDFSFNEVSSVNIQLSATETAAFKGIIAVAYDYQALGATIDRKYSATERNDRAHYTDYFQHIERGMFNDLSENGIVFYIADSTTAAVRKSK